VWAVAVCSVLGCDVDSWMCTDFEYYPIAWYLDWLFRLDQMGRFWKLIIVGVWLCGRVSAWLGLLSYGYCYDCEWFLGWFALGLGSSWIGRLYNQNWILYVLILDRDFCI